MIEKSNVFVQLASLFRCDVLGRNTWEERAPSPRAARAARSARSARGTAGISIMSRGDIEIKSFQCLRRIVTLNLSGIDK